MAWARGLLRGMSTAEQLWPAMPVTKPGQATAQKPALTLTLVGGAASVPLSLDAELVARALRGGVAGAQAEEALYRRYQGAVSRLASSFSELDADEADDVVQEAFVRAFRALPSLKDLDRFAPWLFTIARNLVIDLSRKRTMASLDEMSEGGEDERPFEIAMTGPSPLEQFQSREDCAEVGEVLLKLEPTYREVLVLRFYEELSLEEIATVTRAPLSTVKSRLYRGLAALKPRMEQLRSSRPFAEAGV